MLRRKGESGFDAAHLDFGRMFAAHLESPRLGRGAGAAVVPDLGEDELLSAIALGKLLQLSASLLPGGGEVGGRGVGDFR